MENLAELVGKWREAYESRKELEKLAEQIKKGPEAEAESAILTQLRLAGQESVRLADGGGTVSRRVTSSLWLENTETAVAYMYQRFQTADAEGRPLSDELLMQKRPSKELAIKLADEFLQAAGRPADFNNRNEVLSTMGFKLVETEGLSFTQR